MEQESVESVLNNTQECVHYLVCVFNWWHCTALRSATRPSVTEINILPHVIAAIFGGLKVASLSLELSKIK
jgi:hypothetical protein